MRLLIEMPEDTYIATCNESMLPPDVDNVVKAIKHAQPLFKGTTNGNIIKTLFPSDKNELNVSKSHLMYDGLDFIHEFRKEWWNAPYKGVEE